jgi:iron complex transport system permease protein
LQKNKQHIIIVSILLVSLFLLFLINISQGQIAIPFKDVFKSLTGSQASKQTWEYIIFNYRLPKAITAVLVGIGLSISGLLMQTLFRNPLAGPYVLGLSSGSSLAVAFVIMGASFLPTAISNYFISPYSIMIASCVGSLLVLLTVLFVSNKMRDTMAVLIVGLMFSSFASAIVSVLTYFSSAQELQKFTFWSMGSLGNLSWTQIVILFVAVLFGLLLSIIKIKPLDALLLGENYAKSMGVNYSNTKLTIIIATSILAGSITAFAGPIAFVGLAVPHITKLVFQTSKHYILFFGTILFGGIIMLFCDIASQIPGTNIILPVNAITSIVGAPVVIWLLVRKKSY